MKVSTVLALTLVSLVSHGEAINFGRLLRTTANTMNGASSIINTFLNVYKNDGIVCPTEQFKARVMSTGALCQLENDQEAISSCQNFGRDCISIPGAWGCGYFDNDNDQRRACLFRPFKAPQGVHFPKIIFDHDDDYHVDESVYGRKQHQIPLSYRDSIKPNDADLDEDDYHSSSDYYAKTLITDLERSSDIYDETGDDQDGEPESVVLPVTTIIKTLDMAGIRYPIGQTVCQVCKGTCDGIFSGGNIDVCKYDACVKFLGGYKGFEDTPSCSLILLP